MWNDAALTTSVTLAYNSLGTTASGASGSHTITTVGNQSGSLIGARVRLGGAGSTTTANIQGADTYTISAISGTTITTVEALTSTYSAGTSIYASYASQWNDLSGNNNHFTQATAGSMPLWLSNGQNNKGQLKFLGSQLMANNLAIGSTAFFHMSVTIAGTAGYFVDGAAGGGGRMAMGYVNAGALSLFAGNVLSNPIADNNYLSARVVGVQFGSPASLYANSALAVSGNGGSSGVSGLTLGARYNNTSQYQGNIGEFIIYNNTVNSSEQYLVDQYQSAKWNIILTPPGSASPPVTSAATEATNAMASTGYNVFTTRYLERLAASADIALTAGSGGINLDLQGDTLTLPSETNLSLTTTASGNITNNSTGTIITTRTSSKGNITLNANGNISFTSPITFKTNGGDFTLSAGGTASVNTLTVDTTNNGALTTGNITINKSISATAASGNSIILAAGNSFNIGANTLSTSGTARYLVYSLQASNNTPTSTPGGATAVYSTTYPTIPGTAGNLYLYATALPPSLTIIADNKFKFYNWPNPTFTYTVSGLPAGVQPSVVSGITFTSTAVTGSLPGIYSIIPSGGTVTGSYTIGTYTPGTLTVIKTPPANKCPCLTALGR